MLLLLSNSFFKKKTTSDLLFPGGIGDGNETYQNSVLSSPGEEHEEWPQYVERLDQFFEANDLTSDAKATKRRAIFLQYGHRTRALQRTDN